MTLPSISNDYLSSNSTLTLNALEPLANLFESPNRILHALHITIQCLSQDAPRSTTFSEKGKNLSMDLTDFENILTCYQKTMRVLRKQEQVHLQSVIVTVIYADYSFAPLKEFTAVISPTIEYDLQHLGKRVL